MNTVWDKDYLDFKLKSISKEETTPILIIGGGLAGITCAYHLMKNKIDFILVEARKLNKGVTSGTTAQVTIAHSNIYADIKKKHGKTKAGQYLESQIEGMNIIRKIIKDEKIACDYHEESTIVGAYTKEGLKTFNGDYEILKDYNVCQYLPLNNEVILYERGLEFKKQFIINPIKYMNGLIKLLINNKNKIYENSKVTEINKKDDRYEVIINKTHKIFANKIIMACHYPIINPDNLYFAKIYQSKSYSIAFKTKVKLKANYVSLDKPYYYFRTYDKDTLIIGGSDHYTGIKIDIEKCYNNLIEKIHELDKDAEITHKWFREDCIPIDSLPFIGKYSCKHPNIILVTGFQKWGFTNSHIAAKKVTNMILNKEHDKLYKTNRMTFLKDLKGTGRMIAHSVDGLILSKMFQKDFKLERIKVGSGKTLRTNNTNVLVYRESKDKYIFLENKCTHLGCSLIWNDVDKLWESKCHGSLFDKYGKVIQGPAIEDLREIK